MKKLKFRKGFISQKTGSKITIFEGEKSLLYTLNNSASLIFENLKKGKDKDKIITLMLKKYDIDVKEARKDYDDFIANLKKKGFIE